MTRDDEPAGDDREPVDPVVAVTGEGLSDIAIDVDLDSIAVVFDFVDPLSPRRRFHLQGRKLGLISGFAASPSGARTGSTRIGLALQRSPPVLPHASAMRVPYSESPAWGAWLAAALVRFATNATHKKPPPVYGADGGAVYPSYSRIYNFGLPACSADGNTTAPAVSGYVLENKAEQEANAVG